MVCPTSLEAYVATRADDPASAVRYLSSVLPAASLWTPVGAALARSAGMVPCRFDAGLALRRDGEELCAVVAARTWSVVIARNEAWVDVGWQSDAMAAALDGSHLASQIDFPFLSRGLVVIGSEPFGAFRRFHCRETPAAG